MIHSLPCRAIWLGLSLMLLTVLPCTAQSLPSIGGAWTSGGRPASITQDPNDPNRLVFTNENGWKSNGSFANGTTVVAQDWENGLRGALTDNGRTIRWANGTSWIRAGGGAAAPQITAAALRYRVENLIYNSPDKYLNPRNYHDFLIDFTTCAVRELNSESDKGIELIEVSVCRDKNHLTIKTTNTSTGYIVMYDWVFLENGRIIAGAYNDVGSWGSSSGQMIPK
jgi:hypothetical protein